VPFTSFCAGPAPVSLSVRRLPLKVTSGKPVPGPGLVRFSCHKVPAVKHRIDWERGEVQFSYQLQYRRRKGSVALPHEVLSQLAEEYGPFREIPKRYEVLTSLGWDPVHPVLGSRMRPGIRVARKTDSGCDIEIFVDPHGPALSGC
jgi:hypothetical protein